MSYPKLYIYVPFELKDEVKKIGGKFDGDHKSWYLSKYNTLRELKDLLKLEFQMENHIKKIKVYKSFSFDPISQKISNYSLYEDNEIDQITFFEKKPKICNSCGRHLVTIGNDRKNGAPYNDWKNREYHIKCFKELK